MKLYPFHTKSISQNKLFNDKNNPFDGYKFIPIKIYEII